MYDLVVTELEATDIVPPTASDIVTSVQYTSSKHIQKELPLQSHDIWII